MNFTKKLILLTSVFCLVALGGIFVFHQNKLVISISGIAVPHHDLVAAKRAQFFSEFASRIKQPKTIILISPNHYSAGQGDIQTTDQDWDLDKGKIISNKDAISFLVEKKLVTNEPASFTDEHGIYNILGDIHNNFPNATLIPLIFKEVSEEELNKLEQSLLQSCKDCLMIASVDFSHYQPAVLADLHDDYSIRDLQLLDTKDIEDNIQPDNLDFEFSPKIIKTLSFLHINTASLANNHSDNAGSEGITITRSLLGAAGIQPFGGATQSSVFRIAHITGNGISLAVIGMNLTYPNQDANILIPIIAELKKDPTVRVMIMPHWGEEYEKKHTLAQENTAHTWIDAGADMIIGSHPHVIEDAELYKGAPIIYSLGNLLFDQTFSRATQEGLLIGGKFTTDDLTFFGLPVQSIKYQPQFIRGERKKEILNSLYIPFKNYVVDSPAGEVVKINK